MAGNLTFIDGTLSSEYGWQVMVYGSRLFKKADDMQRRGIFYYKFIDDLLFYPGR